MQDKINSISKALNSSLSYTRYGTNVFKHPSYINKDKNLVYLQYEYSNFLLDGWENIICSKLNRYLKENKIKMNIRYNYEYQRLLGSCDNVVFSIEFDDKKIKNKHLDLLDRYDFEK